MYWHNAISMAMLWTAVIFSILGKVLEVLYKDIFHYKALYYITMTFYVLAIILFIIGAIGEMIGRLVMWLTV